MSELPAAPGAGASESAAAGERRGQERRGQERRGQERRGRAQFACHGVDGGDVPVRQGPDDGERVAGQDELLTLPPDADQVDDVGPPAQTR